MIIMMQNNLILLMLYLFSCLLFLSHSQNTSLAGTFSRHLCLGDQNLALLQLKQEFPSEKWRDNYFYGDGTFYPKMKNWKAGTDCCLWEGVTCNSATGHVVSLELNNCGLHGPLSPNSSLFSLYHLQKLDLSGNNFSFSTIPHALGKLTGLTYLNLSNSVLTGQIPSEITWLRHLLLLDLSFSNFFSSEFDDEARSLQFDEDFNPLILSHKNLKALVKNMTKLRELHLDFVYIPSLLPSSLANLSSLTSLSLVSCMFRGDFPTNVFLLPNIQSITLSWNFFNGFLPEFHSNSSLRVLDLSITNFSGELPKSIGNLKSLNTFDLEYCLFSGVIPSTIGNLSQLTYLDFGHNNFNGAILSTLSNLVNLKQLFLSGCQLKGELSNPIGNLIHLEYLDISQNDLNGQIPEAFANLSKLNSLSLSGNNFEGHLPILLTNLSQLQILNVDYNKLTGSIPLSLFKMASLEEASLSNNQISGPLNFGNVSTRKLRELDLGENNLNGPIPRSISKLEGLERLELQSNNLSGNVDFGTFSELRNLRSLDLSNNNLSITFSNIPSSFPKTLNYLYLSSCNIREFPHFLKAHKQLSGLDLSKNKIQGLIPKLLWSTWTDSMSYLNLSYNFIAGVEGPPAILPGKKKLILDLSSNPLQGSLPIPPLSTTIFFASENNLTGKLSPLLCNLSSLNVLDLSNNYFEGPIPKCLGRFSKDLQVLNLQKNNLHGPLMPGTFTNESRSLRTLDLSHNQLQGKLPRSLIKCRNLEVLNVGYNRINDTFPFWLEDLPELQVLVLKSNNLYGRIWHSNYSLSFVKLRIIDISFNNFDGKIPSEYFKNWSAMNMVIKNEKTKLKYMGDENFYYKDSITVMNKGMEMVLIKILTIFMSLDFSNNNFGGEIPSSIMDLQYLIVLNLSSNSFTGSIPSSFGKMTELESLDLSNNMLSGRIPKEFISLTFLQYLNVSNNKLYGPIPQGGQIGTFLESSFEGNPGLCDFPLKKCEEIDTASNESPESESEKITLDWKGVVTGYGCGIIVGFIAGYRVICNNKNYWFVRIFGSHMPRTLQISRRSS